MAEQHREQWATRAGFLLAAIGSAVGLGNIWRFPYVAYEGGGGAFLLPYLIALLTAGIPLLILVYAIGHRYRGSPPVALRRMSRPAEAIGWWQVGISFVIAIYYAVIIAWAIRYAGFAVTERWGDSPEEYLNEFLGTAAEPGMITSYVPGVVWPLLLVWVVALGVLALGVRRGIERANKIFIPLLAVLFCVLVAQALTLDGALEGLNALFTPDWGAIADGEVWILAYGQIFFSLSIGFGIMITYASYLRRRADLTGSALVAGFANSSFELLAGIGVFAALGFMALTAGVAVDEVAVDGVGLAFAVFPEIISTMPLGALFGALFFVSLVVAGFSSLISIVQVVVAAVQDRFGISRLAAVLSVGGATAIVSVALFPTDQGLVILDVADRFINSYGITLAALVLLVTVAWGMRRLPTLQAHAERYASVPLTGWWWACLAVITPLILGWMLVDTLREEFTEPYEGYPVELLVGLGGGVAGSVIVFAVIMGIVLRNRRVTMVPGTEETDTAEGSR